MTHYKQIINKQNGETEFIFNATLKKIGEKVLTNSNEKEYIIVTIGFELPNGESVERTATCYKNNYEDGIEEGLVYLCNLRFDELENPHITMSHLVNGTRASKEDFTGIFNLKHHLIKDELVE